MSQLQFILDVPMRCEACGTVSRLGDCEPCIASDGSEGTGFGCPLPDCGGYMIQVADRLRQPEGQK